MSLPNPYEPPEATGSNIDRGSTNAQRLADEPQTLASAFRQGVRLGFKWITFIIGPMAAITLLGGIAVILYRVCLGESQLHRIPRILQVSS